MLKLLFKLYWIWYPVTPVFFFHLTVILPALLLTALEMDLPYFTSALVKTILHNPVYAGKMKYGEDYYYRCPHGKVDENGKRCTYSPSWNEERFNHEVEQFLLSLINDRSYNEFIVGKLSEEIDVSALEEDRSRLRENLRQAAGARDKLLAMMERLDESDRHYDKKIGDMRDRLDTIYDKMTDIEEAMNDVSSKIEKAHGDRLNAEQMYKLLTDYGKLYDRMTKLEKKEFFTRFIERIDLDPDERDVTKCIRSIKLMFPVEYKADTEENRLLQENTVETVVLMSRSDK